MSSIQVHTVGIVKIQSMNVIQAEFAAHSMCPRLAARRTWTYVPSQPSSDGLLAMILVYLPFNPISKSTPAPFIISSTTSNLGRYLFIRTSVRKCASTLQVILGKLDNSTPSALQFRRLDGSLLPYQFVRSVLMQATPRASQYTLFL